MDAGERAPKHRVVVGVGDAVERLPGREAALWEAVLIRYARDLSLPRWGSEAREWFASADDDVGAFVFVCQVLGLDPGAVRQRLRDGCLLGSLDGAVRTSVHQLKLIGRQGGAPSRVNGHYREEPRHGAYRVRSALSARRRQLA